MVVSSRSRCPSRIWMVRRSAPASSRWVAKQWRNVCGWMSIPRPARVAASRQASQTILVVIGWSDVCQRLPGNSHNPAGTELGFDGVPSYYNILTNNFALKFVENGSAYGGNGKGLGGYRVRRS